MRSIVAIILTISLLCACHRKEVLQQSAATPAFILPSPTLSDDERRQRQEQIKAELDYYLERHNVQDEGFDMVARYATEGDSTLATYAPEGALTLLNTIRWHGVTRQGKGFAIDRKGRIIIGFFQADTLVYGLRIDHQGTYAGMFNAQLEATGHGSYRNVDGTYYEGHWQNDRRNGFGFSVSHTNLRAGWWQQDRFRGERMQYTSERIYGIDISRYQHEQGRRVYPIQWRQLRITNLGHRISHQRVNGTVDYPVSFVYIKSTQGTDIVNKYYKADYLSCHREQIHVGAYHFFSTKKEANKQALHFLANTWFQHGDLPPMLDIEPSDKQIEQMGGPQVLFAEIRKWLVTVERATGVRPLLYVNQRFVNNWLDQAPDLKTGYHYWIARYGEYKPDIHLSLWQLTSDGQVRGIRGDVDLNVFNGYDGQWQEFLREATVK